jgi:Protein of unknown function (DUF1302)
VSRAAAIWLLGAALTGAQKASCNDDLQEFLRAQRVTALLRMDYFQSSNSLDGERNFTGGTLQLKALPRITEAIDGKVEWRGSEPDIHNRPGYRRKSDLLEGYLTTHFARADLRIGKQIVAWGRADGINPTDNLTPRNYVVLLPLEEDQRFGTTAIKLDTFLSQELTLTAFASSFFEPSMFPLPSGAVSFVTTRPAHSAPASEFALKLSKTGGEFDWSVSYFDGYSLLPSVTTAGSMYDLHYDRTGVFGADLARNFGHFGFRSEMAYAQPSDRDATDPNARNSRLFWVMGADRTFLENLNANLQFFLRWMPHYTKPEALASSNAQNVATLNTIIDGQQAETSGGMTARISNQWFNDTLQAEIFTVVNFVRGDRFIRPLLTYTVSDHVKTLLGAKVYLGSRDAQYGAFEPDNGVFTEVRYGF